MLGCGSIPKDMNKLIFGATVAAALISQGFLAAPALAQYYPNQYQYSYPSYNYGGGYNTGYQCPPGYYYSYPYCYPYSSYSYPYGYNYPYNQYPYYNNYPPTISGVSGPTQLAVGQTGEWSVSANAYSSYLRYSVVWGDEGTYGNSTVSTLTTTGTLAHTYLAPGTYHPRFTATNAYGQSTSASITVVVTGNNCNYYQYNPYNQGCHQYQPYPYGYYPYGYYPYSY